MLYRRIGSGGPRMRSPASAARRPGWVEVADRWKVANTTQIIHGTVL
jgi:hypothetical protein